MFSLVLGQGTTLGSGKPETYHGGGRFVDFGSRG